MLNAGAPKTISRIEKKVYRVQVLAIVSIMLLSNSNATLCQPKLVARRVCIHQLLGRVVSQGDRYLTAGNEICLADRINPINGSTVKAICYRSRQILEFQQSTVFGVSGVCMPTQPHTVRRECTPLNQNGCPVTKGSGEDQDSVKLITPYGNILLNTRPTISWRPVKNATSYTVDITSYEFHWQTEVESTTLPYPKGQQELPYGGAYTITVTANQGNSSVGSPGSLESTYCRKVMLDRF